MLQYTEGYVCKLINVLFTLWIIYRQISKCKNSENRVCAGGEHVCALALITVPSLNQFSSTLVNDRPTCPTYCVKISREYLK